MNASTPLGTVGHSQTASSSHNGGHYAPHSAGLLAPLNPWLKDPTVSDIVLNRPGEVFVEKAGQFERVCVPAFTPQTLQTLFQLIANDNQYRLSTQRPWLSASLREGSRIQLVLPPITRCYAFALRRPVDHSVTLADYEQQGWYKTTVAFKRSQPVNTNDPTTECTLQQLYQRGAWGDFLRQAIVAKKTVVIAGSTGSGKTTFLNACLRHIPHNERLVLLEDTREIKLPHPNHLSLLTRPATSDKPAITLQDLVRCSLRLRPDRLIIGEIRGQEIVDVLGACLTGHGGTLTSLHADNPYQAFQRMVWLYKQHSGTTLSDQAIRQAIYAVVDIIVQLRKTPTGRCVQSLYYQQGQPML